MSLCSFWYVLIAAILSQSNRRSFCSKVLAFGSIIGVVASFVFFICCNCWSIWASSEGKSVYKDGSWLIYWPSAVESSTELSRIRFISSSCLATLVLWTAIWELLLHLIGRLAIPDVLGLSKMSWFSLSARDGDCGSCNSVIFESVSLTGFIDVFSVILLWGC